MIVPMTLTQYMDCFWADDAPYFIPALLTNPLDEVINYSYWEELDETDRWLFGEEAISTRKIE